MSGIYTKTTMQLAHFHDFYFLEALQANVTMELAKDPDKQFSRSVEKFQYDLQKTYDKIVANIAFRTFVYLYAACLGEARHSREPTAETYFIPETLNYSRSDLYNHVYQYKPTKKNIDTLVAVFDQKWSSGFGGRAWRNIAEALRFYASATPAAFIDHVIDLEHNGGTAFNKSDAEHTLQFCCDYPGRLKSFLDYKFSKNILEKPPKWEYFTHFAITRPVFSLIRRYATIFRKPEVSWVRPTLPILTDYTVEWLNCELHLEEKWFPSANVCKGNKPNAHTLLENLGIEGIYAPTYTVSELKKKYNHLKTKAFETAGSYLTPALKQQISKKVKEAFQYNAKFTKHPKEKVTYGVLPCKIQKTKTRDLKVIFPVAIKSFGKIVNGMTIARFRQHIYSLPQATEPGYDSTNRGLYLDGVFTNSYGTILLNINGKKYGWEDKHMEAILE